MDELRRHGFAYGMLAGHLESGEEAFIVEHHDNDMVTFSVIAFSRPATRLAKIAGWLGTTVQQRIGQIVDAQQRAEYNDVLQQEADLTAGHRILRPTGLIAVSSQGPTTWDELSPTFGPASIAERGLTAAAAASY